MSSIFECHDINESGIKCTETGTKSYNKLYYCADHYLQQIVNKAMLKLAGSVIDSSSDSSSDSDDSSSDSDDSDLDIKIQSKQNKIIEVENSTNTIITYNYALIKHKNKILNNELKRITKLMKLGY